VAIFQCHAHADAERIAVLRAVTIRAEPLRARLIERIAELARIRLVDQAFFLVRHDALGQGLGIEFVGRGDFVIIRRVVLLAAVHRGKAAQHDRVVQHLPRIAEGDRPVGIAFARSEAVAERDDEQILDHHIRIGEFAAVRQAHCDRHARCVAIERERHALDDELGAARLRPRLSGAAAARLPTPRAIAGAGGGKLLRRDMHDDRVGVRQDVIFPRGAPGILPVAGC
jgi:hypothetical protein